MLDGEQLARACADAMWAEDHCSEALGMEVIEVGVGRSTLSMTIRQDMVNGHDICHGGMIFTLADSAFAFACNTHNLNAVAAGVRIDFLAPGRLGDVLTARAEEKIQGKRSGVYDVAVTNQDGRTVALFRGNSARIGGALVDENSGEPV